MDKKCLFRLLQLCSLVVLSGISAASEADDRQEITISAEFQIDVHYGYPYQSPIVLDDGGFIIGERSSRKVARYDRHGQRQELADFPAGSIIYFPVRLDEERFYIQTELHDESRGESGSLAVFGFDGQPLEFFGGLYLDRGHCIELKNASFLCLNPEFIVLLNSMGAVVRTQSTSQFEVAVQGRHFSRAFELDNEAVMVWAPQGDHFYFIDINTLEVCGDIEPKQISSGKSTFGSLREFAIYAEVGNSIFVLDQFGNGFVLDRMSRTITRDLKGRRFVGRNLEGLPIFLGSERRVTVEGEDGPFSEELPVFVPNHLASPVSRVVVMENGQIVGSTNEQRIYPAGNNRLFVLDVQARALLLLDEKGKQLAKHPLDETQEFDTYSTAVPLADGGLLVKILGSNSIVYVKFIAN